MKHIKDILYEMYEEDFSIDKQTGWLNTFKLDPITVGRMCEKYPALQIAWDQFKTTYEMCKAQDEANR